MAILLNLLLSGLAVFVSSSIIPGVEIDGFLTAVIFAIIFGILNALLKPILLVLTLPINILTLGLFTFVINLIILYLADVIVDGFALSGLLSAVLFSLVLSIVNGFLSHLGKK